MGEVLPMTTNPFQFRLAGLLIAVAIAAVGCAALRDASAMWTSAVFTFTVAVLSVAMLGVLFCAGQLRAFWIGCTVFGWGYILLTFGACRSVLCTHDTPPLLTTKLLRCLYEHVHPGGKSDGWVYGTRLYVTPIDDDESSTKKDRTPPWEYFHQVGHSLLASLIAMAGGLFARWFSVRHDTLEADAWSCDKVETGSCPNADHATN
jgi:hypothetical protein